MEMLRQVASVSLSLLVVKRRWKRCVTDRLSEGQHGRQGGQGVSSGYEALTGRTG